MKERSQPASRAGVAAVVVAATIAGATVGWQRCRRRDATPPEVVRETPRETRPESELGVALWVRDGELDYRGGLRACFPEAGSLRCVRLLDNSRCYHRVGWGIFTYTTAAGQWRFGHVTGDHWDAGLGDPAPEHCLSWPAMAPGGWPARRRADGLLEVRDPGATQFRTGSASSRPGPWGFRRHLDHRHPGFRIRGRGGPGW